MCGKNLVRLNQQLQCILMYLVDLVDPVDLDNKIAEFTVLVRKTFQSNKIRFDYQRIIFRVRLVVKKNVLVFILKT